jgi:hypothetical protein
MILSSIKHEKMSFLPLGEIHGPPFTPPTHPHSTEAMKEDKRTNNMVHE